MSFPRVTDHAVLRYLERTGRLDVKALREKIALQCADAMKAGATSLRVEGGQFEMYGGVVVTFSPLNGGMACKTKVQNLGGRLPSAVGEARPLRCNRGA